VRVETIVEREVLLLTSGGVGDGARLIFHFQNALGIFTVAATKCV
jgi:hypothetical protein